VGFDSLFEPVPDGPQVQVVLADAEVLLDVGQLLVGGDGGCRVEAGRGDRCADDVDPVEGGLGVDVVLVATPGEGRPADAEDEVLADFPLVDVSSNSASRTCP